MKKILRFIGCMLFVIIPITTGATEIVCEAGYYCVGGGQYKCPENYPNSAAGATNPNDCYLVTSPGKYVGAAGASPEDCPAGSYCPGGTKVYFPAYVFVDYITTSDDASINTKLPLSVTGYKVKTRMALNESSRIFGRYYGWINGASQRYYVGMVTEVLYRFELAWFEDYLQNHDYQSLTDGMIHDYDIVFTNGIQTITMDGGQVMANTGTIDASKVATQYLVPAARNVTAYGMQWYDGATDELLRNFIPAYDTNTQAYGMYDTVSNSFFGNGKWDDLTHGPGDNPTDGPGKITGPVPGAMAYNPQVTGGAQTCPANATSGVGAAACTCDAGYHMHQQLCRQLCVGGWHLKSSTGLNIPLYQEKLTNPAIGIQISSNPGVCYVPLAPGQQSGTLNIDVHGTVYHLE